MYERKKIILFKVVFLIGIMVASTIPNFLVVSDVTNQVNVSNSATLEDKEPAIAVVGSVVHLVWTHLVNEENEEIVYSNNASGSFSNLKNLSTSPGYDGRPAIAVGPNGALHVAWISENNLTMKLDLRYANMINGVWSTPIVIDFNVTASPIDIAISSNGIVHIVYVKQDWKFILWEATDIWHVDNHTGAFNNKIRVTSGSKAARNPRIAVNSLGRAQIVWRKETIDIIPTTGRVNTMYSGQLDETTFSTPTAISGNNSNQMDITVGTSDTVHFVWTEYLGRNQTGFVFTKRFWDLVYMNMSTSGVFSKKTVILTNGNKPSITTDSSGAVHIVWDTDGSIYYVNNKAGSFSNVSNSLLDNFKGGGHQRPEIAATGSNAMITWERYEENDTEIYFVSGNASAFLEEGLLKPAFFAPIGVLLLGIITATVIHLKKKKRG
ncbi:MAG: hypothetical protein ACFFC7_09165 [Candidatus Hermodarchaeota archaeon]